MNANDAFTQIDIKMADLPSDCLYSVRFVGTKWNSEDGDFYVTFRQSHTTYRYERVPFSVALAFFTMVDDIQQGDNRSLGFEYTSEIKGQYTCEKVEEMVAA